MHLSLDQLEQNVVKTLSTMSTNWLPFPHGHPNSYPLFTPIGRGISSRQKW
jgi:hypothetical protein